MDTIGPQDINTFFNTRPVPIEGTVVTVNSVPDITDTIFKTLYAVYIPMVATRSTAQIDKEGFVVTGHKAFDEDRLTLPTAVHLSINRMLEVYLAGYKTYIPNPKDHVAIYEAIHGYLSHWSDNSARGQIHRATIPKQDLEDLDDFADSIYRELRERYNASDLPGKRGISVLEGLEIIDAMSLAADELVNTGEQALPSRETLADMFKNGVPGAVR